MSARPGPTSPREPATASNCDDEGRIGSLGEGAAGGGDLAALREILEAVPAADPNIGEGEHSPLARAAEEGRGDILDLLLTHGATEERVAGALAYLAEAGMDSAAASLQGSSGRPR